MSYKTFVYLLLRPINNINTSLKSHCSIIKKKLLIFCTKLVGPMRCIFLSALHFVMPRCNALWKVHRTDDASLLKLRDIPYWPTRSRSAQRNSAKIASVSASTWVAELVACPPKPICSSASRSPRR